MNKLVESIIEDWNLWLESGPGVSDWRPMPSTYARELLAHIERLEKMRHGFAEDYKKWWKANVEISFDQWINFESTHWTSAEDAAYQAWQHLHENVVYPMQKNIERLAAQLAEAKNLYLHERTEGLTDQEQQEEWDGGEEYFERQMALTAQKVDKGERW